MQDPRIGSSPEWAFGIALLPVGALYFYKAHTGCMMLPKWPIQAHLFWETNFYLVLVLGRILGRAMGGCKTYGGGKCTRERALPKMFGPLQKTSVLLCRGFFAQEKQSTDT